LAICLHDFTVWMYLYIDTPVGGCTGGTIRQYPQCMDWPVSEVPGNSPDRPLGYDYIWNGVEFMYNCTQIEKTVGRKDSAT